MSDNSFLKSYTHDGGSQLANSSLKARELGLMERMDALLAGADPKGADSGFIARVTAQAIPIRKGATPAEVVEAVYKAAQAHDDGCSTCAHAEVNLTPNDSTLIELDQRINGLWGNSVHDSIPTAQEGHSCPGH